MPGFLLPCHQDPSAVVLGYTKEEFSGGLYHNDIIFARLPGSHIPLHYTIQNSMHGEQWKILGELDSIVWLQ